MTRTPAPTSEPTQHTPAAETDPGFAQCLDRGLRQALVAPAVPTALRVQLMAAVHTDGLRNLAERRVALEREHAEALQQLHRGHVRLQRDTLALVVAAAFTAGACASLVLPWLNDALGVSGAVAVPLIAVLIGVTTGASVWWDRFGRAR